MKRKIMKLIILLTYLLGYALGACPPECRCLWKSSKITVECTNINAKEIPDGIDGGTQVLNMTGNNLQALKSDVFGLSKLLNLQKINVAHSNISDIHPRAFSGLLNLVDIDLSHNKLAEVPSDVFPNTLSLMILTLSRNPITVVKAGAFTHLRQLTKLDLSNCKISEVSSGAFYNLQNLERLYLEGNRLRSVSELQNFPPSLHGISLHENPWHCDCQLKNLRDWLTKSNVPRLFEPVCQTPRRLQGFKVGVISIQEFACLPTVSPTSMYLTVRERKNVSLTCRVKSDPLSDISWTFNGLLIDNHHPRIRIVQQYEGILGTRSELLITNTSNSENGSFLCSAENRAGKSAANYTLHVESYKSGTMVMEMKMEHFVAVSVCVITVLVLLLVIVTILLVKIARKHLSDRQVPENKKPSSMPRSIQMGTGPLKHTVIASPTVNGSFYSGAPDLLSGVSQSHSSDTSCASMDTVTTPASSDCSADVNDIIKDLSKTENREPLIGQKSEKKKSNRTNVARSQTLPCFSQNDKNQTINHQYEQHFEDNELPLRQTMYPSTSTVPWSRDNPYLHTSGHPYIISRQRPVRPDEQYPVPYDQPSLQYQYSYYPDYQPMFSSLNNYFYPSDHPGYNGAVMYPMNIDQHPNEIASAFHVPSNTRIIEKEITKVNDQKPVNQNGIPQPSSEDKTLSDGEIIKEDDSTKDILSKLQGEGVRKASEYESDKESEGISEELESAFQNLSMTNNSWDEGTQI
eukprot:TRINITY_DN25066_c0_g1_i1.p1 TRINITY_DN25066_c0_g1~~TRINITY_DN25066_c0_g1_i1.p1  ORF type:complete len:745 (+),score=89.43 TRINITY_DN25066_c0_g1_i1:217-2451(+)